MLDYQQIVDTLRIALYSADHDDLGLLRLALADYSAACDQVNQRLNACAAMLRKGLRSEAIRLAEMEPRLLDITALLDFPERNQLSEKCRAYGWSEPPRLLEDIAAQLNEAYSIEQPLAVYLRWHRLLAMARAPLKQRIGVLRKLAELDPANPVWTEDLLIFEKERLRQIQDELGQAARNDDLDAVQGILQELTYAGWMENPPLALQKLAESTQQSLVEKRARRELETLEPQLNAAYCSFDLAQARQLRQRWQENATLCRLSENDPLTQRVQPALAWLAQEDEKQAKQAALQRAIRELEQALDNHKPLWVLERLYYQATREGHELPAELESRYRSRVANLELAADRRRRIVICAVAGASLFLAAIVAFWIIDARKSKRLADECELLEKYVSQKQYQQAEKRIAGYKEDWLRDHPRIIELAERVGEGRRDEQQREERVRTTLKDVSDFVTTYQGEISADNCEEIDAKLRHSTAKLDDIANLARTDEEKIEIADLRGKLSVFNEKIQKLRDDLLLSDIENVEQQIKRLESVVPLSSQECMAFQNELKKFETALAAFEDKHDKASTVMKAHIEPYRVRAKQVRDRLASVYEELSHVDQLARVIGSVQGFSALLEKYCAEKSGSHRAADYQRVLSEQAHWHDKPTAWNAFARYWNVDRAGWSHEKAEEAQERISKTVDECEGFPEVENLRSLGPHLSCIAARRDEIEPLMDWLSIRDLTSLFMLQYKDGKRFYLRYQPPPNSKAYKGENCIISLQTMAEKRFTPDWEQVVYNGPAPQNALSAELRKQLRLMRDETWEETFCQMLRIVCEKRAAQATAKQPPVDPILSLQLLRKLLDVGCRGSYAMSQGFAPWRQKIDDSGVKWLLGMEWVNPDDPEVAGGRKVAEKEIDEFKNWEPLTKKVLEERRQFLDHRVSFYHWVGFLNIAPDKQWECRLKTNLPSASGELWVFCANPATGKTIVKSVGRLNNGVARLDPAQSDYYACGRPIFLSFQEEFSGGGQ